ncbi:MAG: tagaturonate reductase [Erysipelotrichales bacterium]|nr:tagaturonate reductase [Erysipelotrichales bacterium]
MEVLNEKIMKKTHRPVKILQFGEGNFLRAFIDWFIQTIDNKTDFNGGVAVVQPLAHGRVRDLEAQDGLYTLLLEGVQNGEVIRHRELIDVLEDYIDPYTQYDKFLSYAKSEDLKITISNTTEAGIAYDPTDLDFEHTPKSYPGKLLALLKARYDHFRGAKEAGLFIIACELIDNNGDELKKCLVKLAKDKGYDEDFLNWLTTANRYYNTLVDRIVPGYPRDQVEKLREELGYIDNNMVKGEIFHLWVVEGDFAIKDVFPVDKAGLNIILTDNVKPYKERKVKILNGAHTCMVPIAYQMGKTLVSEMMNDETCRTFLNDFMHDEVWPTIKLTEKECESFTNDVFERFMNPTIRHELLTISLNSMTKYKTRILPSAKAIYEKTGVLPKHALFSLACLFNMYSLKTEDGAPLVKDDPEFLELWAEMFNGTHTEEEIVKHVMSLPHWEYDFDTMKGSKDYVAKILKEIRETGVREALRNEFGL